MGVKISRRQFLQAGAFATTSVFVLGNGLGNTSVAEAATPTSPSIKKWLDQLPIPPALTPDANVVPGADYYRITMEEGTHQFYAGWPAVPSFGYGGLGYLGPTIVAQRGRKVFVDFANNLPSRHLLHDSIDQTICEGSADYSVDCRVVPHLHGGFTLPQFDGHPMSCFSPGQTRRYEYSNAQRATLLWYHDHAMGITRLNVYAGLAAAYVLRDELDTGVEGLGLNIPKGAYEVPLVIQDKIFNPDGSMFYPTDNGEPAPEPYPHPIWVPEFFGDTPVVNGKVYPYLDVEPRRYRLRFLNGSQARFYNFWFEYTKKNVRYPFWLIGTEGGLLPAAVRLNSMLMAPAERPDIIFDFSQVPFGTTVTLMNNAKAPYPGGQGGTISQIVQFRVVKPLSGSDTTDLPANLPLPAIARLAPTAGAPMREIVMREVEEPVTGEPEHVLLNGYFFMEGGVTETPHVGDTEIWQFINLTVDAHPMHMHLVQFQVYDRQPFDAAGYMAAWDEWVADGRSGSKPVLASYFTGAPVPPPPEEMGWKDTVKSLPGQITRVIATFDVPGGTPLPAEYVYHCHILEHEENEMMRPFTVTA